MWFYFISVYAYVEIILSRVGVSDSFKSSYRLKEIFTFDQTWINKTFVWRSETFIQFSLELKWVDSSGTCNEGYRLDSTRQQKWFASLNPINPLSRSRRDFVNKRNEKGNLFQWKKLSTLYEGFLVKRLELPTLILQL